MPQVCLPRPCLFIRARPTWGRTPCYCEDTRGQSTTCEETASVTCICLSSHLSGCRRLRVLPFWLRHPGLGEAIY